MNAVFGVLFHFIGGFASGSFYVPYKKVEGWSWESMWILGGLFSWIIVPPFAAWLTIPNFWEIISNSQAATLYYTFLFGLLWGIGGLTYGLGIRYLGVSLGSSIILGLSMVFGSLMPSLYYFFYPTVGKHGVNYFFTTQSGTCILIGLLICLMGVVLCGRAGVSKEKSLATLSKDAKTDYNFTLGIIVSIISGVLSACFNFGIEAGKPLANVANSIWKNSNSNSGEFLYQNNVTYIIILWGGFTTNFIWCVYLLIKNRTFSDYTKSNVPKVKNLLFCALAGTMWYLQFFFYGMGESRLGNGASSWILHMAFIILISNAWGIILNEWKGVNRMAYRSIIAGIVTIIISICVVGFARTLEN
ncbi:L-rhamnose/proton symporter RhaT [Sphingobacterium anhuiense]|uniref:L-rhamnose/proton symporter RhaT n=1 Tax=Sphingobacterium anhuiense TaxID=493780 RepID=A0ABW5Z0D8_9SPHI